jgi:uncharacterized caspase-like protein
MIMQTIPRLTRSNVASLGAAVVLALVSVSSLAADDKSKSLREALVIGNGAYQTFDALDNPVNDMTDMCEALRRVGFKTTCFGDVTDKQSFLSMVREFSARRGRDSATVFFYAGHAVQINGENYLVPTEARLTRPTDIHEQFVALNEVFSLLGKNAGRFQMIVLDACRNDPFAPDTSVSSQTTRRPKVKTSKRAALVGAMEESHTHYGLTAIKDAPPATMVLYATASEDSASDGEGRNGPLTKHFLQHLKTRGLGVDALVRRVMEGVQKETQELFGKPQTPFVYSSYSGDFCFNCSRRIELPPTF